MFPRLEEGGLATYRAALVQNQHLTVLAEVSGLALLYAYCIVYVAVFSALAITVYFQWGRTTPAIAPFPGGSGPHLICGSLGQPESTTQMDQFIRFCTAHSWVQLTDRQV